MLCATGSRTVRRRCAGFALTMTAHAGRHASERLMNDTHAMTTFKIGGDLEVNRLGYGAMRLTGEGVWGPPKDVENAKRVLRRVVELGVNFIDTADSYGPDVSEAMIGEVLSPFPKGLVIATKGGFVRTGPHLWRTIGRRE